ncbi:hypothetical protein WL03_08215 [Burkholderia ubonensis]|uniref:hypothetical protein n=1 Tax=Burkholderia ubonensis TaxID=101571 RepID=UPI00076023DD|nr:hypothetical protein [Burkholderia ubonensis]KVX19954.1 hypothetical protein WL03_08215 [Burkholderia ubonensis]
MTNPVGITAGCPQRFALRASAVLYVALAVFIAAAAVAVHLFVAPRAGVAAGAGAGALAVTAALLAFGVARTCARRLPAEVQVDALGEVAAFGRAGQLLARGRVTGYAHWSSLLLVLSVGQGGRRARPLLIPADALDAPAFSALSVLARTATAARPA